jgi:serine/threonine protein kinase
MPASLFPLYPGEAIDSSRLRLHTVLGMGGYGVFYRAYDTRTHETYAVKWLGLPLSYVTRTESQCAQHYALLHREIQAHEVASDLPNVVTLHRTLVDNDRKCFWLVLDLIPGADMFDAVQLKNPFWRNEERTRSVVIQLVDAVANLHARKVYHRDIKPENVLLSTDPSTLYLSDFGSGTSAEFASENTGTEEYMSPGMFDLHIPTHQWY